MYFFRRHIQPSDASSLPENSSLPPSYIKGSKITESTSNSKSKEPRVAFGLYPQALAGV
jgi:hypothetical protein